MASGLTLSPSPLRVLDRAVFVMLADPWRPVLAMTVFFLAPYLAGYFLIYAPLIDGTRDYGQAPDTAYMIRYYGFIAWYFVLKAAAFCSAGRLIHDRLRGLDTSFVQAAREAPWLWLRGLVVYVVFFGAVYLGQTPFYIPAILAAYVAAFILPPFLLERKGPTAAVKAAWSVLRGRRLIALVTVVLAGGFGYGAQWAAGWLNSRFAGLVSFAVASVALNVVFAAVQLIQTTLGLSLYACCRERSRPPDEIAQTFD